MRKVKPVAVSLDRKIVYPDSDGKPMSDNTQQFRWIVLIKENLEILFADRPDIFVAGDLLWYPVEGQPKIRIAPDAMVVFGRPKGDRGSYQQWKESNIVPQVVFEVLSPGNTLQEMTKKQAFYERYGVQEYYIYDPDQNDLNGFQRSERQLEVIDKIDNWVSPLLGIRFELTDDALTIYTPQGQPFLTPVELAAEREQAQQQAKQANQQAEQANQQAEQARQQAEQARQQAEQSQIALDKEKLRAQKMAEHLRSLGVDPDSL